MRRILGSLLSILLFVGPAQAGTVSHRVAFKIPAQVVSWTPAGLRLAGTSLAVSLNAQGCVAVASNAGFRIGVDAPVAGLSVVAVSSGPAARAVQGAQISQMGTVLVMAEKTAVLPGAARSQAITFCVVNGANAMTALHPDHARVRVLIEALI